MTRTARASHRAKEAERARWMADSPAERERCPDTLNLEDVIARMEAADRLSTTPARTQ